MPARSRCPRDHVPNDFGPPRRIFDQSLRLVGCAKKDLVEASSRAGTRP